MGYKLAGCDVVGDCEIDPRMNRVYVANHRPKHNYLMDVREFNKLDNLPDELYNLDILDASPPCTTFSLAGQREKNWGVAKKFREGQAEQTLDDLAFVAIETARKLNPKVCIMENVEGLLKGEAWSYVQRIYQCYDDTGYNVKHWLLKGEQMGVPQARHRVFFIAVRKDIDFDLDNLDMSFNYAPILFGEVKDGVSGEAACRDLLEKALPTDTCLADVLSRTEGRNSRFNECIVWDDKVAPTVHTHGFYRGNDKTKFSWQDYRNCSSFAQDYDFGKEQASYICGMSVPPIMIKRVVQRLIDKGLFGYKIKS